MKWNFRRLCAGAFWTFYIKIHNNRLLAATDDHRLARLVLSCVDLLMRHVGWNVYEVAGAGFITELEMIAPAHASAALHDVKYSFQFAMVVRSGFCIGLHNDRTRPELGRPCACVCDCCGTRHTRGLRRVRVQFTRMYDLDAVILPFCICCTHFFRLCASLWAGKTSGR